MSTLARASPPAAPPPPGRWTSSSTTSGSTASMTATACRRHRPRPTTSTRSGTRQLAPDPGAEHRMVVDQDDPGGPAARACRHWSSCLLALRAGAVAPRSPRRGWIGSPRPAVAGHPVLDALADAVPVLGDRFRVEADAAVADEDRDPLRRDLGVDVHPRSTPACFAALVMASPRPGPPDPAPRCRRRSPTTTRLPPRRRGRPRPRPPPARSAPATVLSSTVSPK